MLTGHRAESTTPDSAVANLQRTIDAEIWMAERMGQDLFAWYEAQQPDAPEFVATWCRLVTEGAKLRKKTLKLRSTPRRLRVEIVTKAA